MRGQFNINNVRTRFDYEVLTEEDKAIFRSFLKGTIDRQVNTRTDYPEGYWELNLKEGDEGYLEPILEDIKDYSTIERFGFNEEEL
jgi:hypothetical protein